VIAPHRTRAVSAGLASIPILALAGGALVVAVLGLPGMGWEWGLLLGAATLIRFTLQAPLRRWHRP